LWKIKVSTHGIALYPFWYFAWEKMQVGTCEIASSSLHHILFSDVFDNHRIGLQLYCSGDC
jgi:hypothetical protein